jgi:nitric oxide reductase activation protein
MCGDVGYEVLDEIERLPERLPMLYRALAFSNP